MTQDDKYKITSNDYFDLLVRYNGNPAFLKPYEQYSVQIINIGFAVIYIPVSQVTNRLITDFGYASIPKIYTLASEQSLEASGVLRLRRIPAVNLRGQGVITGFADTGIDYTNPVFMHTDGTTKVLLIWDQTIDSIDQYPKRTANLPYYGTEYTAAQINQALQSPNPLQVVPSMDELGHGTMLAGIAAGSEDERNNFSGVAPDSNIMVVKLKQAKENLRNFYSIPLDVPCYQENDILWAIQYMLKMSRVLQSPLAMCLGLGTSQGAHDGSGYLNDQISIVADFPGVALTTAAGNEGNARRHFYSELNPAAGPVPVELNVSENENGFCMELWGNPPTIYTLDILTPGGEYIPRISEQLEESRQISFIFEQTVINIDYILIEEETGKQVILLRFRNPSPGIWKFQIYGRGDLTRAFDIWLPSGDLISRDTYFLNSNQYTTVTSPGDNTVALTAAAYNSSADTLYINSGRGYTTTNVIKPDLAAPGVNIQSPTPDQGFQNITGTGAAAAHTAGITAMLLEWSIIDNNYPGIDTVGIKKFLIRGAKRNRLIQYPNRDWGYGIIDIYNSFNIFRTDVS